MEEQRKERDRIYDQTLPAMMKLEQQKQLERRVKEMERKK